jgi:Fibronectin type III domain
MNPAELQRAPRWLRAMGRLPVGLLVVMLMSLMAIADGPITSSSFVGAENPLSENGAWAALTSLSPSGGRFQKNNGAFPNQPYFPNHAGARTTAVVPADHYSEIVVGHVGSNSSNVGPIVRVQASGPSIDSHYLWWASGTNGVNNLYRIDANGTTYTANVIMPTSPVVDGDRLRLIARGPVIYGIKNGVREFIYNTGPDATKYSTGTAGMLAYAGDGVVTNAMIASWAAGTARVSSGTWTSSAFTGIEDPLDEGDRWYPLPGYSGFKKVGGLAIGRDSLHNASGVWSITPPARQYSEVTLGTVASGGGGPIVRIDRSNTGQTGWLLFLGADNPQLSGIYKMNPDGSFTPARLFTATVISGDKWRLTADGNTLEVFQNGVSQFAYTTDGSYTTGDVGIEAYTSNFTFTAWEGGDTTNPQAPTAPGLLTAMTLSSSQINLMWTAATDPRGVTGYLVERCQGVACTAFAQIVTVTGTTYNDTGLAANTSYSYRVRATDAAGNVGPYSNVASAMTPLF